MARIILSFDLDMVGKRLINLGDAVGTTDAATKGQLDAGLAGKLDAAEKGQVNGIATLDATGKVPSPHLPPAPAIILSGTDHGIWIDLNSTSEQILTVPHDQGAVPAEREVFFEPVTDVALDVDAVCLDHVKYLAAQSNAQEMMFSVKLREGSGTAGQQGQLRVLTFAG